LQGKRRLVICDDIANRQWKPQLKHCQGDPPWWSASEIRQNRRSIAGSLPSVRWSSLLVLARV
jgi:hypothetical protein